MRYAGEQCTCIIGWLQFHHGNHFFTLKTVYFPDPKSIEDVQVVEMPIIDSLHPRPDYLPLSFPKDLSDRLLRLHGDPTVWWIGQFIKYLTRPQAHLKQELERAKQKLGFTGPIVG